MFGSVPILVAKRTMIVRILLFAFLLPVAVLTGWGFFASLAEKPPEPIVVGVLGGLFLASGGLFVFLLRRELGRETRLYPEGMEQVVAGRTRELRWEEVTEVWFQATKVQAGGLIGAAVGAAMDRSARGKGKPLDERSTSVTVKVVGRSGEKFALTSNDKGVVAAFEEILRRVNPRLFEAAKARVEAGETVSFGKVSISLQGLASGRKAPVAFHEVEKLEIAGGRLVLKKKGAWLAAFSVPIGKIPNVFVLTELHDRLAVGTAAEPRLRTGRNLAQRMFV